MSDPLKAQCPHCKHEMPVELTGAQGDSVYLHCQKCKKLFSFKRPAAAPAAPPPVAAKPASAPSAAPVSAPVPAPTSAQSNDRTDPFWQPPTIVGAVPAEDPNALALPEDDGGLELENSTDALLNNASEVSVKAEFGSMDDYAAGAPDEFVVETTSHLQKDDEKTQREELPPKEKAAAVSKGGGDDFWAQMNVGTEPGDLGGPIDGGSEEVLSEEELLAGLEKEKQRVAQESKRLEQAALPLPQEALDAAPPVTKPAPTAKPAPKPAAAPPAKAPAPAKAAAPKPAPKAAPKAPPVTPKPPPPVEEPPLIEAEPAVPAQLLPAAADPMLGVTPKPRRRSESSMPKPIPSVEMPVARKSRGAGLKPAIVVPLLLVGMLIVGGVFFAMGKRSSSPQFANDGENFSSKALEATKQLSVEKNRTLPVSIPSTATTAPTISPPITAPPIAGDLSPSGSSDKSPYDQGMEAYRQHTMDGYREAEKQLLKAFKDEDKSPRTVLALSELYSLLGGILGQESLLQRSFKLAQSMVTVKEHEAGASRALAQAYFYSRQYPKAYDQIQKALALNPQDKEGYLIRGLVLWKTGQGGGGLLQAYKMDNQSFRPQNELARFYLDAKRYSDALETAQAMIKNFPVRYEGYFYAMQAAAKQQSTQLAQNYGEQALPLNPKDPELNAELAQLYLNDQKPEKAADMLQLFLAQTPKLPRADLAKVYGILGRANLKAHPDKAVFYFEQLLKWDVDTVGTLNYLGLASLSRQEYQKSADYFSRALKKNPNSEQIKFNLALTHYNAGSLQRAQQLLTEICAANGRHEEANFYLANVYEKLGDRIHAIQSFDRVLLINPGNQAAREKVKQLKAGL